MSDDQNHVRTYRLAEWSTTLVQRALENLITTEHGHLGDIRRRIARLEGQAEATLRTADPGADIQAADLMHRASVLRREVEETTHRLRDIRETARVFISGEGEDEIQTALTATFPHLTDQLKLLRG